MDKKKHIVRGFGAGRPEDDPKENALDRELEDEEPAIEEELVALIFDRYEPVETLPESTDQKTTLDLIEEMEAFTSVSKFMLVKSMKACGFKPYYTGDQFVWLLKERQISS